MWATLATLPNSRLHVSFDFTSFLEQAFRSVMSLLMEMMLFCFYCTLVAKVLAATRDGGSLYQMLAVCEESAKSLDTQQKGGSFSAYLLKS